MALPGSDSTQPLPAFPAPVPCSAQGRVAGWRARPPLLQLDFIFTQEHLQRHQSQIRSHSQEPELGLQHCIWGLQLRTPATGGSADGVYCGRASSRGVPVPSTWPQALLSSLPSSFPVFVPFSLIFWDHKVLEAHSSYGFFASALESTTA